MEPRHDGALLLVFTNPVAGQEDEFNRVYDESHLPEVLATPGIRAGQRYRRRTDDRLPPGAQEYLAVYEIEGDPEEFLAAMVEAATRGDATPFPANDRSTMALAIWEPMGPRREAGA